MDQRFYGEHDRVDDHHWHAGSRILDQTPEFLVLGVDELTLDPLKLVVVFQAFSSGEEAEPGQSRYRYCCVDCHAGHVQGPGFYSGAGYQVSVPVELGQKNYARAELDHHLSDERRLVLLGPCIYGTSALGFTIKMVCLLG